MAPLPACSVFCRAFKLSSCQLRLQSQTTAQLIMPRALSVKLWTLQENVFLSGMLPAARPTLTDVH